MRIQVHIISTFLGDAYGDIQIPDNYQQFLQKDGLKGARIGVLRELSEDDPDSEVKALFEQAIEDLKSLGAEITRGGLCGLPRTTSRGGGPIPEWVFSLSGRRAGSAASLERELGSPRDYQALSPQGYA